MAIAVRPHGTAERSPTQKRVWNACRQLRRFTTDDVIVVTAVRARAVRELLQLWRRGGLLHGDNDGFRLAQDLGPLPPYLDTKKNELVDRNGGKRFPLKLVSGNQRLWDACRELARFTLVQIVSASGVNDYRAAIVLRLWRRASLVEWQGDHFALVRDLGPRAPLFRPGTLHLVDPNNANAKLSLAADRISQAPGARTSSPRT